LKSTIPAFEQPSVKFNFRFTFMLILLDLRKDNLSQIKIKYFNKCNIIFDKI